MSLSTHDAKVAHLLRRTGFTCTKQQVDALLPLKINQIVDQLLQNKQTAPYPPLNLTESVRYKLPFWWLQQMLKTTNPLQEKMTLFWHGHFTSSFLKSSTNAMANQNMTLRRHALGNFRKLAYEISIDPAMMLWLDNHYNLKQAPNENYARELMELFTLGLNNYTEKDVSEVARALTGWRIIDNTTLSVDFYKNYHDDGKKTFLGKTGTFGLKETINILVEHPATARWIAKQLWEYFAYPKPEKAILDQLQKVFRESNYEIKSLLRAIFTSDAFYSDRAYRSLVKSPAEYMVWVFSQFPAFSTPYEDYVVQMKVQMGQYLFNPPNVSGWQEGAAWLGTSMLLARYSFTDWVTTNAVNLKQFPVLKATDPQEMLRELINKTGLFDLSTQTRTQIDTFIKQSSRVPLEKLASQVMQLLLVSPEAQMK